MAEEVKEYLFESRVAISENILSNSRKTSKHCSNWLYRALQ